MSELEPYGPLAKVPLHEQASPSLDLFILAYAFPPLVPGSIALHIVALHAGDAYYENRRGKLRPSLGFALAIADMLVFVFGLPIKRAKKRIRT